MKYLICEDFSGSPIPFLFPDRLSHMDMREQLPYARILSAGYTALENGAFVCYGGDAAMDLTARPKEDAALLTQAFSKESKE